MSEPKCGKFIVFEGLDGAGKTSCIEALKRELSGDVLYVKEPGGTPFGEKIRTVVKSEPSDPLTQLFLFLADRREHMKQVIIPALQKGTHVITDRFMASTYAFQIVAGEMLEHEDFFWKTHEMILGGFVPDHYFFVTITPNQARERLVKRVDMDHFEKDLAFQTKVREGYEVFMKKVPSTPIDGGVELSIMQKEAVRLVKEAIGS